MLIAVCVILPFCAFTVSMAERDGFVALESIQTMEIIFGAFAGVCALSAIFLVPLLVPVPRRTSLRSASGSSGQSEASGIAARLLIRAMLAGALTEIAGLFGFILFVMGEQPPVYAAFIATSLVSSILTWPRKSEWVRFGAEAQSEITPPSVPGVVAADQYVESAASAPLSDFAPSTPSFAVGLQGQLQEEENQARGKFRIAVLVRGVSLAVVVAFPVLAAALFTLTLKPRAFDESGIGLVIAFGAISALCAIGALFVPQLMVPLSGGVPRAFASPANASASPLTQAVSGKLFSRAIIASAFTNIPALFGLVLFVSFSIDLRLLAVFIAATIVSSLLTFPRWSAWDQARMDAAVYPPMG